MKNQNQQPTPTSQELTEAKAEVIKLGVAKGQASRIVGRFSLLACDQW